MLRRGSGIVLAPLWFGGLGLGPIILAPSLTRRAVRWTSAQAFPYEALPTQAFSYEALP